MKKILAIIGTRPNIIKMSKDAPMKICWTGQHYDSVMKDVFFRGLKIRKPDYDIHAKTLGQMIDRSLAVIEQENPEFVFVVGDTNSSLAGAIAANQKHVPIIHLEAGCRSFDNDQIEERNRLQIDSMVTVFLCPSEKAKENLEREGKRFAVFNVGAAQLDSVFSTFPTKPPKNAGKYRLLTLHRQSNVDQPNVLKSIIEALGSTGERFIFPIHPRTAKNIKRFKITIPETINVVDPMPYKKMIHTLAYAKQLVTDSGGLQVEAYFLRVPCVTIRNSTEWTETVDEGWNKLASVSTVADTVETFLPKKFQHNGMVYGKGGSWDYINRILNHL